MGSPIVGEPMLCYAMLCYAMLHHGFPPFFGGDPMLCHAVLCYAVLCYAMLHHGIPNFWGTYALPCCTIYAMLHHIPLGFALCVISVAVLALGFSSLCDILAQPCRQGPEG